MESSFSMRWHLRRLHGFADDKIPAEPADMENLHDSQHPGYSHPE